MAPVTHSYTQMLILEGKTRRQTHQRLSEEGLWKVVDGCCVPLLLQRSHINKTHRALPLTGNTRSWHQAQQCDWLIELRKRSVIGRGNPLIGKTDLHSLYQKNGTYHNIIVTAINSTPDTTLRCTEAPEWKRAVQRRWNKPALETCRSP